MTAHELAKFLLAGEDLIVTKLQHSQGSDYEEEIYSVQVIEHARIDGCIGMVEHSEGGVRAIRIS